jgi:predicted DNA-binding protein
MARQSEAQVTFRLARELVQRVDRLARASGRGRSAILREAAEAYVDVAGAVAEDAPAERVRGLIGSVRTGIPNLAEHHSDYVKRILRRGR